ncbi:hypothetical protein Ctha_1781 [Chloroherpeton thalassium ATCC 35110]|uniref:Uncharacterized protein n=1 Tax=Chloroherpeton thalassium (strain ATCC 35110 / GB-78) TaxID=517418 RepID=B3QTP0_CHLT3|nr:hypothetical protein [Chloroherpeton thalassium]ACF14238.1 hypothetical protein Ctha_1781 [Chloroherpeton thalassium ATCC 35110]
MKIINMWQKIVGLLSVFIVFLAFSGTLLAQESPVLEAAKDPCNDSLYLRLKDAPPVSLTESERAYVKQKRKECEEYRYGKIEKPNALPEKEEAQELEESLSELKADEEKPGVEQESFLSARNIGIFSVVIGAVTGLIIAIGNVTEAPF